MYGQYLSFCSRRVIWLTGAFALLVVLLCSPQNALSNTEADLYITPISTRL